MTEKLLKPPQLPPPPPRLANANRTLVCIPQLHNFIYPPNGFLVKDTYQNDLMFSVDIWRKGKLHGYDANFQSDYLLINL